ncbi:MAG: MFS transporter [Burkholderiaceae bacterium]|nr:MFS transporter [Burkholderiaceae bacterium]MCF8184038.1 MFS transporter [Polynucleobacter sp.]
MSALTSRSGVMLGLGVAVAAYLLSFFHRVAPAAISGDLQATFAIGGAQLGTLAATYFYVYTLMQIPTGVLADTLGPRRILFWGGLVAGVGAILFGLAPTFELAFAGRTLVGLGVSVTFIAMLKLIALGFEERRFATLVGLCMLLGNFGSILAGAPLAWATQAAGWRQVFVVVGLLSFALAFASRVWVIDTPAGKVDRTAWLSGLLVVLKNRATWPGFFANTGLSGAFFAFAGLWAVPYLTQMHGMTRGTASGHVSIYFLGFAFGSALWGRVSDALGRRKAVALAVSGLHVLGWAAWLWATWQGAALPLLATYALCGIMGLASAGFTLSWASAKEVNPPLLSGMATSVVNVGVFLGPAILQPLVGWLMERSWDGKIEAGVRIYSAAEWRNGMLLMAVAAVAGWLATLFVKETGCRNVWRDEGKK